MISFRDSETNAPNFDLTVENNNVSAGVRHAITHVEYESTDGMAAMMKITAQDPTTDQGQSLLRDSKIFMPGNEVSLFIGYGTRLSHVGRAIIRRIRPNCPANGMPTIEIVGYSADSEMADSAPEALKEAKKSKRKGTQIKKSKAGRRWKNAKYSDAVRDRAESYDFIADVDETHEPPGEFIHKAGLTDYDFIKGISHLTGFYFWVDADASGQWTLHFKDPQKLKQSDLQDKEYVFKYGEGDYSTLLSFEPELAIQNAITKLLVQLKDPITGNVLQASIEEENDDAPDPKLKTGNVGGKDKFKKVVTVDAVEPSKNKLEGPLTTASDIKIFLDDFSFEVRANRRFKTEAELALWAEQWFRRNRENFLLSSGTLIGLESMNARQQHRLRGVGNNWDGLYYFSRVRHMLTVGDGYHVDFSARRIVPDLPPVSAQIVKPQ